MRDTRTRLQPRIKGRYPPGSTWKIPMAMSGLEQGAITVKNSNLACGGGITIGNKFTRCMGSHGSPDVRFAIRVSCDGYFYRLGLKMKLEGIMKMVDDYDLNKKSGVDLPHELVSWTPSREFKKRFNPRDPEWRDIDTVYASFGQVYDFTTPIAMLRAVASIGVGGKLTYAPFKEDGWWRPSGFPERPAAAIDVRRRCAHLHGTPVVGRHVRRGNPGGTAGAQDGELRIGGKTAPRSSRSQRTGENKDPVVRLRSPQQPSGDRGIASSETSVSAARRRAEVPPFALIRQTTGDAAEAGADRRKQ